MLKSSNVKTGDEMTPLLGDYRSILPKGLFTKSKAVIVVLMWNLAINLSYALLFTPKNYLEETNFTISLGLSFVMAGLLLFSPLAGFLADVKFGRYKTVLFNIHLILITFTSIFTILVTDGTKLKLGTYLITAVIPFFFVGYIGFNANIIQFGLDQLRDAPSHNLVSFLSWYFWVYNFSSFMAQGAVNIPRNEFVVDSIDNIYKSDDLRVILYAAVLATSITLLAVFLLLVHKRQAWFLIEPGGNNPYKLVYRVIRFACLHKIPVNRSAFTYCEDELPSRLDLGKSKYGGPFTTEQVEDVKVFLGILKVLFSIGPIFFINVAVTFVLSRQRYHRYSLHGGTLVEYMILDSGLLSTILIIVFLPLYLCILRPFISYHIPGMLKRIGISYILLCISLAILLIFIAVHDPLHFYFCVTTDYNVSNATLNAVSLSSINTSHLILQRIISALFEMMFYISVWEFICCQSPHSMKGLIFGVFYAIQGLFQFFALLSTEAVYIFLKTSYGNCAIGLITMNIVIGVVAFLVYVCVSKRYKYRMRDEPSHVRRYAEEYYSNIQ